MSEQKFQLYNYTPSSAAAMIFLISFALAIIWHTWIIFKNRVWYFIPLIFGGILEVIGYVGRFVSSSNPSTLLPFIIQSICLLVAPALLAASIYMVLGRLIVLVRAESMSLVRLSWLTKIFVGGDLISFLVQVMGAGLLSSAKNAKTGKTVILIGLVAQIIFFGLFVVVAALFHRKMNASPTSMSLRLDCRSAKKGWRGVMWTLYIASLLIFIRSLFRLIEYTGGNDGPLLAHEVFLYIFDAILILATLIILGFYHPCEYVPNKKEIENMQGMELI